MNFKEELPENCPDGESQDGPLEDVWRFLVDDTVSQDSFSSHAALQKQKPEAVCGCRWSSCSLYEGEKHAAAAMKTPMLKRFKYRAELTVPAGSGRWVRNGTHIDFWAYSSYDFVASVKRVVRK